MEMLIRMCSSYSPYSESFPVDFACDDFNSYIFSWSIDRWWLMWPHKWLAFFHPFQYKPEPPRSTFRGLVAFRDWLAWFYGNFTAFHGLNHHLRAYSFSPLACTPPFSSPIQERLCKRSSLRIRLAYSSVLAFDSHFPKIPTAGQKSALHHFRHPFSIGSTFHEFHDHAVAILLLVQWSLT